MKLKNTLANEELAKAWGDEQKAMILIHAVALSKVSGQFEKVRALLLDKRPEIRKAAMTTLADLKDGGAMAGMMDIADTGTGAERLDAIRALAKIGKEKAPGSVKAAERMLEVVAKVAASGDKQLMKETMDLTRALISDKRIKAEDQKRLTEKLPKGDGTQKAAVRIADLKFEDLLEKLAKIPGDKAAGAELYKKQTCVNCHTLSSAETPKGPFLGDIGVRYKRLELVDSVVRPSNVIAFGFNTHLFTLESGERVEGFVAKESGDELEVRNISGEVKLLPKSKIKKQVVQKQSTMPEGLVENLSPEELASLIAYLESLKAEKK